MRMSFSEAYGSFLYLSISLSMVLSEPPLSPSEIMAGLRCSFCFLNPV